MSNFYADVAADLSDIANGLAERAKALASVPGLEPPADEQEQFIALLANLREMCGVLLGAVPAKAGG
ncbi:hypothetical protein [Streptomyces sp. gCLA4]|uniref:hypothetical protein n=1 Tax=Streptomyces sp. gCLA4 TaxID=1873416 RepID=UPI001601D9EB|nr:hypothetical protein [Streptomyces sp. gCLA4]